MISRLALFMAALLPIASCTAQDDRETEAPAATRPAADKAESSQ